MMDIILKVMNAIFGPLLALSPTFAIAVLGVLNSAVIVLARKWTTDQDFLKRCHDDKRRLKVLIKEARAQGDKETVARRKMLEARIGLSTMKSEGKPLLIGLLPIALFGLWGYSTLAYLPPRDGEPVTVELSLPASADGQLVSMVPQDGLTADAWIQRAKPGEGEPQHVVARWEVSGRKAADPYILTMRVRDETYLHPFKVGQVDYTPPVLSHTAGLVLPQSVIRLKIPGILGCIPWISPASHWGGIFPAWLLSYIIVVVPAVLLLKRTLGIY